MLDRFEYYHGAAILRLMEDDRYRSVKLHDSPGYVVNENIFIFLKYTTKGRSPWGFTFDQEDIDRCLRLSTEYNKIVLGFICGGDGVCALDWKEAKDLLGSKPGRIAAGRKHKHSYSVWGSLGKLKHKIPVGRWPSIVFEQ